MLNPISVLLTVFTIVDLMTYTLCNFVEIKTLKEFSFIQKSCQADLTFMLHMKQQLGCNCSSLKTKQY